MATKKRSRTEFGSESEFQFSAPFCTPVIIARIPKWSLYDPAGHDTHPVAPARKSETGSFGRKWPRILATKLSELDSLSRTIAFIGNQSSCVRACTESCSRHAPPMLVKCDKVRCACLTSCCSCQKDMRRMCQPTRRHIRSNTGRHRMMRQYRQSRQRLLRRAKSQSSIRKGSSQSLQNVTTTPRKGPSTEEKYTCSWLYLS